MLSISPSGPVAAEDIRHLKRKPSHGFSLERLQGLDRTDHLPQNIGGHLGIQRRGLQLLVPEQHLDNPNILLLLLQMGGKAVPQRMHRHPLVYPRRLCSGMNSPVELTRTEWVDRLQAWK